MKHSENKYGCSGCFGVIAILALLVFLGNQDFFVWHNAHRVDTGESYQEYLERFPNGKHAEEAQAQLKTLLALCPGTEIKWDDIEEVDVITGEVVEHWRNAGKIEKMDLTRLYVKTKEFGRSVTLEKDPMQGYFSGVSRESRHEKWLAVVKERAPHVILKARDYRIDIYQNGEEKSPETTTVLYAPTGD